MFTVNPKKQCRALVKDGSQASYGHSNKIFESCYSKDLGSTKYLRTRNAGSREIGRQNIQM